MTIALPLLTLILGLIMYCVLDPKYPKWVQVGYVMFCCGLLVTLFNRQEIIALFIR